MIHVPKLTHVPANTIILGGVGFALGHITKANPLLSAAILATSSVANYVLFKFFDCFLRHGLKAKTPSRAFVSQTTYTSTNLTVSLAAIFAARHFELISRRSTGACVFLTLGLLATRLMDLTELFSKAEKKI
jgi:hypothetical protein